MKHLFTALTAFLMLTVAGISHGQDNQYILTQITSDDYYLGDKDAPNLVLVYSSLTCPKCKEVHNRLPKALNDYLINGEVTYVYRSYIYNNIDFLTSLAARCAKTRRQYFQYIDLFFDNQEKLRKVPLNATPQRVQKVIENITGEKFEDWDWCVYEEVEPVLEKMYLEAKDAGITKTPAIYLNGESMDGWKQVLNALK